MRDMNSSEAVLDSFVIRRSAKGITAGYQLRNVTENASGACDEGTHRIVENGDGFKICEKCDLTVRAIRSVVGHSLTADEYHLTED